MTRPRLLDLFCGAGGAAMGYHRAGFDVVGVDHLPQPRYPFLFIEADATTFPLDGFDAVHASPPCQAYSAMKSLPWLKDIPHPRLLEPTFERLQAHGVPFVIENVERAPMAWSVVLCGLMFGLPLYRHRRFTSNVLLLSPPHVKHRQVIAPGRSNLAASYPSGGGRDVTGVLSRNARHIGLPTVVDRETHYVDGRGRVEKRRGQMTGGGPAALAAAALDIDWMRRNELTQAIPPAYTEHVGRQLIEACR